MDSSPRINSSSWPANGIKFIEYNDMQLGIWPKLSLILIASSNSLRILSSASPTYLIIISGPLTILGSFALNVLPSSLAINVLPVPGGPYKSTPLTCYIPYFSKTWGGKRREANARRKILSNSISSPPIPIYSLKNTMVKFISEDLLERLRISLLAQFYKYILGDVFSMVD